jgi:hypothetical protein
MESVCYCSAEYIQLYYNSIAYSGLAFVVNVQI